MGDKVLMINGKRYAYYQFEGTHLFLNMVIQVFTDASESEDWLSHVIGGVEHIRFTKGSYLNVNAKG